MLSSFKPAVLILPRSAPLFLNPNFFLPIVFMLAAIKYGSMVYMFSSSTAPFMPDGQLMGGDFYVFWTCSQIILDGYPLSTLYDPEFLREYIEAVWNDNALGDAETSRVASRTSWQYPPTFGLAIKPLAYLNFSLSYALWSLLGFALFIVIIQKSLKLNKFEFLLVLCCPLIFYAVITGQNGLFTAGLLFGAAYYAGSKPVLAGLCAGLLMIKPHFGLLLPFVFVSAGYWRTFGVAAITSILFMAISIIFFGYDAWIEFPKAILETNNNMADRNFATHLMRTPFALGLHLGLSSKSAMWVQILCSLTLIFANCWLWNKSENRDLKTAFLLCSAILVVPYAFHYELIFLIPAAILLLRHINKTIGWTPLFEVLCLFTWFYIDQYPILDTELRMAIAVGLITTMLILILCVKDLGSAPNNLRGNSSLRP